MYNVCAHLLIWCDEFFSSLTQEKCCCLVPSFTVYVTVLWKTIAMPGYGHSETNIILYLPDVPVPTCSKTSYN